MKPDLWQDEAIGAVCHSARLLFLGLISQADDAGRLRGDPRLVSAQIFPYDDLAVQKVEGWLAELDEAGLINRYENRGRPLISLPTWERHQKIDRPSPSTLPGPENEGSTKARRGRSEGSTADRKGREGSKEGKGTSAIKLADAPLSHLLADLIEENGSKRPEVGKAWVDAERLLLSKDERPRQEAESLLRWCQAHEFWRSNVLSMPTFRRQYDKLRLQAQRRGERSGEHPADQRIRQRLEAVA